MKCARTPLAVVELECCGPASNKNAPVQRVPREEVLCATVSALPLCNNDCLEDPGPRSALTQTWLRYNKCCTFATKLAGVCQFMLRQCHCTQDSVA